MEKEKKIIVLSHYFLSVVYDEAKEKPHFNMIFGMLSMMEQVKKLIVF